MSIQNSQAFNPLANFMRQPKIYINLPSNGTFWKEDSINMPPNGELPVYSMTAKDELAFKTPDALMNGQAVVDVIQSCVPAIKNAWDTPNIDLDIILIAIRIATYGELMTVSHTVPNTSEKVDHELDLRTLIDQILTRSQWQDRVDINEHLTCFIKPLTYHHVTQTNLKTYETQKLMQAVNNDDLSDEKKLEIFNTSFKSMSNVTIGLIADSVIAIQTPTDVVTDQKFIKEFVENADSNIIQRIQDHIASMKKNSGIQPVLLHSTTEQIEQGAPESYELPISMDNSDFFGRGS